MTREVESKSEAPSGVRTIQPICIFHRSTRKTTVDLATFAVRILDDTGAVERVPMCASVSKRDGIGVSAPNGDEQHPRQHAELIDGLAWVARLAR